MKRTKRIILATSTIFMSLCLMVFGVFAALQQDVTINGQIDVNISSGPHARVAVVASSKTTAEGEFTVYGTKGAFVNSATFTAPTVAFNEDVYYMVHSFEFSNYANAIDSLEVTVEGLDEKFVGNFNCFIGETEKSVGNQGLNYTSESTFLNEFTDVSGPQLKRIYVYIELKDEVTENDFSCQYRILIQYDAVV